MNDCENYISLVYSHRMQRNYTEKIEIEENNKTIILAVDRRSTANHRYNY